MPLEIVTAGSTTSTVPSGVTRYNEPAPGFFSQAIDPAYRLPAGSQPPSFIRIAVSVHICGSGTGAASGPSARPEPALEPHHVAALPARAHERRQRADVQAADAAVAARVSRSPANMSTKRRPPHDGDQTGPSPW